MKAKKYIQMSDDCTVMLMRFHKTLCCDCGLVHLWELKRIKKGIYGFRIRRDNQATAQMRKNNKYEMQKIAPQEKNGAQLATEAAAERQPCNTGSPKFPTLEECYYDVRCGLSNSEFVGTALSITERVYNYMCRRHRTGIQNG
jgi:hypothetical protein